MVEPGLRSQLEDRWRAAYEKAASGTLGALREADPELVAEDSERLGAALARVLDAPPDGDRALVVGHSPTNEPGLKVHELKADNRAVCGNPCRKPLDDLGPGTVTCESCAGHTGHAG